jgi:acyl-coenzyme A synthetase/AMP-(fatty) acid ligase
MVPRVVRFVDGFPMTSNGKADRQRLASLLS